ncbi:hypothetical protein [Streptomyces sp. CB01881]|uniref:hypothetical protein n=1 Tax=Streptomyces sp. CB01881 TaxID=2078691 RepID=UPI00188326CE|nr:hypothetical protein [Streptomyces sp. CB01881]
MPPPWRPAGNATATPEPLNTPAASTASTPAADGDQPRSSTRKTRANTDTVNCGTTSSVAAPCSRHNTGVR